MTEVYSPFYSTPFRLVSWKSKYIWQTIGRYSTYNFTWPNTWQKADNTCINKWSTCWLLDVIETSSPAFVLPVDEECCPQNRRHSLNTSTEANSVESVIWTNKEIHSAVIAWASLFASTQFLESQLNMSFQNYLWSSHSLSPQVQGSIPSSYVHRIQIWMKLWLTCSNENMNNGQLDSSSNWLLQQPDFMANS